MKKINFLFIFLIFALVIGAVASEDVEDAKTQIDLIFNVTDFDGYSEVTVNFPSDAQGTVNFTINNEHYVVNVVNGEAKLNVTGLEPGEYILKANYSGDDKYMSVENKTSITISAAKNTTDNSTDTSDNTTDDSKNAAGGDENDNPSKNTTPTQNSTPQNNTTIIIINQTQNQTPVENNTTDNVTTTVDNSTNPPKKEPDEPPFKLDAKTGIPIVLVIIAIVILIAVRKYDF